MKIPVKIKKTIVNLGSWGFFGCLFVASATALGALASLTSALLNLPLAHRQALVAVAVGSVVVAVCMCAVVHFAMCMVKDLFYSTDDGPDGDEADPPEYLPPTMIRHSDEIRAN
jgi:hypothetical protein